MLKSKKRVYIDNGADYEKLLLEAARKARARNEEYLLVEDNDSIYEIDVKCFLESKKMK